MSEILSQEEIDALLKGSLLEKEDDKLTNEESDALFEMLNISMNVLSNSLFTKLKTKVTIKPKQIDSIDVNSYNDTSSSLYALEVNLAGTVEGKEIFIFNNNDVLSISDILMGGNGLQLDDNNVQTDVFLETIKETMPESVKSMAEVLGSTISFVSASEFDTGDNNSILKEFVTGNKALLVSFDLEVGSTIKSSFEILIPISLAKQLVNLLLSSVDNNDYYPAKTSKKDKGKKNPVAIQPVSFPEFNEEDEEMPFSENMEFIMDVPLKVSVELGSTKKTIQEILNLNIGSIVELDNLAEGYVDVLVNGKLVARGEVIVVDENFGVRIMELYTNNRKNILNNQ